MLSLTSTELPTEVNAGVIVTLAERSVDATKAGRVTPTLAAVALSLTAADLGLIACKTVTQQGAFLTAFALCSHEAWLARAYTAVESPLAFSALAAVCFRGLLAVT